MAAKFIFWISIGICWCLAFLFGLGAISTAWGAPSAARKSSEIKKALEEKATQVDSFIAVEKRLPQQHELEAMPTATGAVSPAIYIHASRSEIPLGFDFPRWSQDRQCYALSYWRGKWHEFYDSNSQSTSVDNLASPRDYLREALVPLGLSASFTAISIALMHRRWGIF